MRVDRSRPTPAWIAFLRRARIVLCLAVGVVACMHAVGAPQDSGGASAMTESPAEAYARLVRALRDLESSSQGASPRNDHRRTGGYSAASQAQLEALRRISGEIVEVLPQLPRRDLDYSQGFSLLLPHLADSRLVARALAEVGADALRSGDAATFERTLEAQRARIADSAQDDILISSLVAMSASRHANGALREALSSGLIDATAARAALETTESLAAAETYRIDEAIALEGTIVVNELSKIRGMTPEAREVQFQQLTGSERTALGDAELDESIAKAPAYFAEARAAMSNPDRAKGRAALEALEARAQAGEFGGALTVLAASYTAIQQRLVDLLAETNALRADLSAIARGEKPAEAFMNAAELYVAAGKSLRALDGETQRDIEAMRVAGDQLPEELRARALAALRAARPNVVERLLRAARCERCDFTEGAGAALDLDATFLIDGVDGVAGAMRLMLVEPLVDPMPSAPADGNAKDAEPAARDAARIKNGTATPTESNVHPADDVHATPRASADGNATPRPPSNRASDAARDLKSESKSRIKGEITGAVEGAIEGDTRMDIARDGRTDASTREVAAVTTTATAGSRAVAPPAATPADRVVAALIAIRRYADGRAFGRSLVAQQMARDCAEALECYRARGWLDKSGRQRIAETLATLDRGDPFGFTRALPRERQRIAELAVWGPPPSPEAGAERVNPFSTDVASKLPPHAVAFILGMCTPLAAIDPAAPDATIDPAADRSLLSPLVALPAAIDGPFSDLRGWFDLAALREANGQRAALRERLLRAAGADSFPLAGLVVTRPVDIDRRIAESQGDLERLDLERQDLER